MILSKTLKNFCTLTLLLCICACISSCSKDSVDPEQKVNKNELVGEWKAVSIKATFSNGEVWTTTDQEDIKYELEGLEWVVLTESTLTMMSSGGQYPYELKDKYLTVTTSALQLSLGIESVNENEIVIRYIAPNQSFTSLITYKKEVIKPIDKKELIGEWKARKIVATFEDGEIWASTNENQIKYELAGLEWVKLTESTLTMMDSGASYPYSVQANYLTITSSELLLSLGVVSVNKNEIIIRYIAPNQEYISLITYKRVD